MIYDEITPSIHRSVISRMEEKIQWKEKQNYQEIYGYFSNEFEITTTTSSTTTTEENSTPPTTIESQPDNASVISWSLASLIVSLSFVVFAA